MRSVPLPIRFWAKVDKRTDEECWRWTGAVSESGYGRIKVGRSSKYAHRISLEVHGIGIPPGMNVDHLCENKQCVNPLHLDIVTHAENLRRSRMIRHVA